MTCKLSNHKTFSLTQIVYIVLLVTSITISIQYYLENKILSEIVQEHMNIKEKKEVKELVDNMIKSEKQKPILKVDK